MPQQFHQNPLEQFEPEKLPVGWPWRLFTASFVIFLAAALTYVGLIWGYEPYLNSQIKKRDIEIEQLAQTVSKEKQEEFIRFYSQMSNLKELLNKHNLASKAFSLLEKMTNQKVYYTNAYLKVDERTIEVDGVSDSYGVLAEQLEAFHQTGDVERHMLNQSQLREGRVRFKATLTLKETLLRQK